jgi:hypothetical protein
MLADSFKTCDEEPEMYDMSKMPTNNPNLPYMN